MSSWLQMLSIVVCRSYVGRYRSLKEKSIFSFFLFEGWWCWCGMLVCGWLEQLVRILSCRILSITVTWIGRSSNDLVCSVAYTLNWWWINFILILSINRTMTSFVACGYSRWARNGMNRRRAAWRASRAWMMVVLRLVTRVDWFWIDALDDVVGCRVDIVTWWSSWSSWSWRRGDRCWYVVDRRSAGRRCEWSGGSYRRRYVYPYRHVDTINGNGWCWFFKRACRQIYLELNKS